jgi:hypothetical protein
VRKTLCVASLTASLFAADSAVDGPKIGYVNSAAGVRKVLGSVGASRLSEPVTGELKGATVLPGQDAVVTTHPEGGLVKINLNDGSIASMGIADAAAVMASPSGSAVAAVKDGRVHVISADGEAKAEYALPGRPLQIAVADGAATVAVAIAEDGGEALYVLTNGASSRVLHAEGFAGVAFVPESNDAFVATKDGSVYLLKGDLQVTQIATIQGATAVAAVASDKAVVVAGKILTLIHADGTPVATADCSCEPAMARPLGASKFQLTAGDDGPIWLVDASTSELRVAFVPEAVNE